MSDPIIKFRRGTRQQLDTAGVAEQLHEGAIYLITDEDRIAVGLSATEYQTFLKEGEGGGGTLWETYGANMVIPQDSKTVPHTVIYGLGDAALLNVGFTSGTVAHGDHVHGHITDDGRLPNVSGPGYSDVTSGSKLILAALTQGTFGGNIYKTTTEFFPFSEEPKFLSIRGVFEEVSGGADLPGIITEEEVDTGTSTAPALLSGEMAAYIISVARQGLAAQVNSDWDATEGVAEILNKPTIPAAQVNADWEATEGVAKILNKPDIPDIVAKMEIETLSTGSVFTLSMEKPKLFKLNLDADAEITLDELSSTYCIPIRIQITSNGDYDITWKVGATELPTTCWQDETRLWKAREDHTYIVEVANVGNTVNDLRVSYYRI